MEGRTDGHYFIGPFRPWPGVQQVVVAYWLWHMQLSIFHLQDQPDLMVTYDLVTKTSCTLKPLSNKTEQPGVNWAAILVSLVINLSVAEPGYASDV